MLNFNYKIIPENLKFIKKHIHELKYRFYYIIFSFLITFFVSYYYINFLIHMFLSYLMKYSKNQHFIYTHLIEIFLLSFQFSLMISLFFTLPFLLFQIWLYFIPSFYNYERKLFNKTLIGFYFFIFIITIIIYFIILPYIWNFLIHFEKENILLINFEPKINEYFSFIFNIIIILNFISICILINLIMLYLEIIKFTTFLKFRKYYYFLLLLLIAFFMPPDFIGQFLVIFITIFFYEIIIYLYIIYNNLKK